MMMTTTTTMMIVPDLSFLWSCSSSDHFHRSSKHSFMQMTVREGSCYSCEYSASLIYFSCQHVAACISMLRTVRITCVFADGTRERHTSPEMWIWSEHSWAARKPMKESRSQSSCDEKRPRRRVPTSNPVSVRHFLSSLLSLPSTPLWGMWRSISNVSGSGNAWSTTFEELPTK